MFIKVSEKVIPNLWVWDVYKGRLIAMRNDRANSRLTVDDYLICEATASKFQLNAQFLIYHDSELYLHFYDLENDCDTKYNKIVIYHLSAYRNNYGVFRATSDVSAHFYGNFKTGEIIHHLPVNAIYRVWETPTEIVILSELKLICINVNTGELLWEKDLKVSYDFIFNNRGIVNKTFNQIGIWKDILIMLVPGFEIAGVDVRTGGERWRFEMLQPIEESSYLSNTFPHLEGDRVYFFEGNYYFAVNLKNQKTLLIKKFNTETDWTFRRPTFQSDFIYFVGGIGAQGQSPDSIGAFNRKTLQVDWYEKIDIWKEDRWNSLNHRPVLSGNKLYLMDANHTLRIFERNK